METFLAEVARTLREKHPQDLDKVTVVFNNQRSGLFLRRQFADMQGGPFFLPRIIGIDELISEIGNLEIVPNEFLLFELFKIHCAIGGENRKFQTFEEFISFGDMMLVDFSEIDLYCVDAQQLFSNLHEIKSIGEWDVESGTLTEFQKRYLEFYHSLYKYYDNLHLSLLSKRQAFSGMAYRYVAENIETLDIPKLGHKIYFVGFNALSTSENIIIKHFMKLGQGELITDGDAYYFNDKNQEAGHFLRKNRECGFPSNQEYQDHFALSNKEITIASCPESVLQCKYAGELLAEQIRNNPDNPIEQTAIVLGDESLLIPMLNSLPPEIDTANITMGYPFRNTAVHSLMLNLFSLHSRRREQLFYHQDIFGTLTDLGISKILANSNLHSDLLRILSQEHIIYATSEEIADICKRIKCDITPISFIFSRETPSPDEFLSMAEQLVKVLYATKAYDTDRKEREALACLLEIIHHFQGLQDDYHFVENISVLQKIYLRLAQRRSVSFYGKPLKGLQILGVLETRNLDFKRIILLSANEGTIPSSKTSNTLIPYNLKVAFGIPTFHDKDAVYAYNFYRLLQRADNIHLLYCTESNGIGKGEPSRFILQVRRELALRYPDNINLHEKVISAPIQMNADTSIIKYPKHQHIVHRINQVATNGLYPSSINTYRSCSLKFFYEKILSIKENDTVDENMESNELGSYIHAVFENIYKPFIGKNVDVEFLKEALENIDEHLNKVLDEKFMHNRSHLGRNHYLESVAKMQITRFLSSEIKGLENGAKIKIIGLEEKLSSTIHVNINNEDHAVTIAGIADRIDQKDEIVRIIDYKSGKVEDKELSVKDDFPNWEDVPDKWFQVMTYAWLYKQANQTIPPLLAGIQPLQNLGGGFKNITWNGQEFISNNHFDKFEEILQQIAFDLLNPDYPFQAQFRPNKDYCKYCSFLEICKLNTNSNAQFLDS